MCDGRVDFLGSGCGIKNTVTIDTDRHAIKFLQGAGGFFQKAAPASQGAQNLLAGCIFVGEADKSAFALLLARVTEPRLRPESERK